MVTIVNDTVIYLKFANREDLTRHQVVYPELIQRYVCHDSVNPWGKGVWALATLLHSEPGSPFHMLILLHLHNNSVCVYHYPI